MRTLCLIVVLGLVTISGPTGHCQNVLNIPGGVRAWGMGGAGGAIVDPFSAYFNPGGFGVYSLDGGAGVIRNSCDWLPAYDLGIEYNNTLVFAGYPLPHDAASHAPRLAAALAFHRQILDYEETVRTNEYSDLVSTFHSYDRSNNFTLALGAEFGVEVGAGLTIKSIKSVLADQGAGAEIGSGEGTATGRDFGIFARVPLFAFARRIAPRDEPSNLGRVSPEVILAAGQSWHNRGSEISFIEAQQADPLPRLTRTGLSARGQLEYDGLPLCHAVIAVDHEDLQVTETKVDRNGWEVGLFGAFAIRGGHIDATGYARANTDGMSFHLGGVARWVGKLALANSADGAPWYLESIDVYYQKADVDDDGNNPMTGTALDEYGVVVNFPRTGIF